MCDTPGSSCTDRCGYFHDDIGSCQCDDVCIFYKDCGIDYENLCIENNTKTKMTSFSGKYFEKIFTERVTADLPNNLSEDQFSCRKLEIYMDSSTRQREISVLQVIDKCLAGYSEIEMKGMCESNRKGLQLNVPVTDYKFLYKNTY